VVEAEAAYAPGWLDRCGHFRSQAHRQSWEEVGAARSKEEDRCQPLQEVIEIERKCESRWREISRALEDYRW
jgi:hypothetical protein